MPQELQETDFIVLRTTRYGEGKLIVNGLTPSGRLSFIVYGAVGGGKKGGLDFELFRLLHVSYQETDRDLQKCSQATVVADYAALARHFDG
ncbi:MAG: recombination protein O N-terminal domain-containing protein, partial [Victivallales bacterium]|nr:recombination protein O N-terminal domain-containing protein [Victivallales bacterium]